jgi:protoporphyrinogen oxidase
MQKPESPQNRENPHPSQNASGRVLVLGGGLAGLSVAREALRLRRCQVTVLEKQNQPGGMAASFRIGEHTADLGPHRIFSTIPEMRDWFHRVLGDKLFVVRRRSSMYVRGRYLRYPPALKELIQAFGVTGLARFGMGYAGAQLRAWSGRLRADTFAGVMERAFGLPLCEALVFPYIRKTWKIPPEQVSVDVARTRATMGGAAQMLRRLFHSGEASGNESSLKAFHYVQGGIGKLPEQLAAEVRAGGGEIVCGARVSRIVLDNNRVVRVDYQDAAGRTHAVFGDFVFSTIPLNEMVEAMSLESKPGKAAVSSEALEAARVLRFLRVVLVYAIVRKAGVSGDHWLYYPESEPRINRAHEPRNFDASLSPGGHTVLCMEGTALGDDPEWSAPDGELGRRFVERMASTGLVRPEDVKETVVHRLEHGYPLYDLEYTARLRRIWQALQVVENLIPLGRQGLFQHNNMDHAIYTGLRAAKCWSEEAAPAARWYSHELRSFQSFRIID